jgi:hypothetical protein
MWNTDIVGRQKRNLRLARRAFTVVSLFGASAPVFGQWIHYPTADVPRMSDGTPNLAAPPPRLRDGKPDFSGIWHTALVNQCVPETGQFCGPEIGGSPLALDIGRNMPGGLPLRSQANELLKKRTAKDDPHVRCLPDSPPRTWVMPHLTKAVHTPRLLVLLYEVNAMYRQIFIDGRQQPEDPVPSWTGYSTARWQGDTLVVETKGFRDDLWIDMKGSPISTAATMTERISRPSYERLSVDITIDDPKMYTKPWMVHFEQELMLDTELIDEICLENEKSWQHMQ